MPFELMVSWSLERPLVCDTDYRDTDAATKSARQQHHWSPAPLRDASPTAATLSARLLRLQTTLPPSSAAAPAPDLSYHTFNADSVDQGLRPWNPKKEEKR